MKICAKCGAENKDSNFQCINCFESLKVARNIDDKAYIEEKKRELERILKAKRNKRLIFSILYLCVCLALIIWYICSTLAQQESLYFSNYQVIIGEILIISYGMFYLIKPMLCFQLEHFMSIENIDNVSPTDLYVFDRTAKAYIGLAFAPISLLVFTLVS